MTTASAARRTRLVTLFAWVAGVVAVTTAMTDPVDDAVVVGTDGLTTSMSCDRTSTVEIAVENTGTTTWTPADGYSLTAIDPDDDPTFGFVARPVTTDVDPGEVLVFTFTLTSPPSPGTHALRWRMARQGVRFGAATPAITATVTCPLADAFSGARGFVEDQAFAPPAEMGTDHAETTTARWGDGWVMLYRTFVRPDGSRSTLPTGIGRATSADGDTWTAYDGGRPVLPNGTGGVANLYFAPSVIADTVGGIPGLTMVFEANPHPAPGRMLVAAARSVDGGITWTDVRPILQTAAPWEGSSVPSPAGNVGTPSILKVGSEYRVSYHGYRGTDGTGALKRGVASGTSLDTLSRWPSNPQLQGVTGTWTDVGIGRGDVIREGGYYYTVFEAARGSATCAPGTVYGWGLARSTDMVTWQQSPLNPIMSDRVGGVCGNDMPAFQVIDQRVTVVTTGHHPDPTGAHPTWGINPAVRRFRIGSRPTGLTGAPIVGLAATPSGQGYWQVNSTGGVFAFGDAGFFGSASIPAGTVIGLAATPSGQGYWITTTAGQVHAFGDATPDTLANYGVTPNRPISGIEASPTGGFWLVGRDGGIYGLAGAPFHGSAGGSPLNADVVGMAATPNGGGYWLVAADGGVFSYGNAGFHGSAASFPHQPIVGMARSQSGAGYWLVATDGGTFTFGDATYHDSTTGVTPDPILDIVRGPGGTGYWMQAQDQGVVDDGGVIAFGSAAFHGHARRA